MFQAERIAGRNQGNHIKAGVARPPVLPDIGIGRRNKPLHFAGGDRFLRRTEIIGRTGFHLHNNQHTVFFGHEVQFQVSASPVCMADEVALPPKIVLRPSLAPPSYFIVCRHVLTLRNNNFMTLVANPHTVNARFKPIG